MKNTIEQLILKKGLKKFTPTKELLQDLNTNQRRFGEIRKNLRQPNFEEAYAIAKWLGVTVDDLYIKGLCAAVASSKKIQRPDKNVLESRIKSKLLKK
jgi:transcriptional regulator with XRE-family HTH domain